MSGDHYLAGPCDGISIHNDGCELTIKDKSGREDQTIALSTEEEARRYVWVHRDRLYAKYEIESGANAAADNSAPAKSSHEEAAQGAEND